MGTASHGDTGAHAAPENDGEDDVMSGARSVDGLRGCKTIRVVLDPYASLKGVLEILLDGLAKEPGGICSLRQSRPWLKGAWDANADAPLLTGLGFKAGDQVANDPYAALIIVAGRIHSRAEELAPIRLHGEPFNLCAAPINADEHLVSLRMSSIAFNTAGHASRGDCAAAIFHQWRKRAQSPPGRIGNADGQRKKGGPPKQPARMRSQQEVVAAALARRSPGSPTAIHEEQSDAGFALSLARGQLGAPPLPSSERARIGAKLG